MNRPIRESIWLRLWATGLMLLAVLPLAGPSLASAQEIELPTTIEGWSGQSRTMGLEGGEGEQVLLSLEQVIQLALERNLRLVVERYRRSESLQGILENQGIYDFELGGVFSTSDSSRPVSSILEAADTIQSKRTQVNFQLRQLTPFGGTVQLDFNNSRDESSNLAIDPNPSFTLFFNVGIVQPLLRNFGRDVTERNLVVARTNAALNREDFQAQVEDVVQQVTDGYWNLVEALEQLKVAEESLRLAEDLDRMNRIQVEVGTLPPLETVRSEAGVAAQKEAIIRLRSQVGDAADVLRRLVNLEAGLSWERELVPTTKAEVSHQPIDLAEAVRTALESRPDLKRQRLQNDVLALDAKVAENQKKPRVDLTAGFGLNAIDGDFLLRGPDRSPILDANGNPIVQFSRGYGDAVTQLVDGEFSGWQVRLDVGYPLQNREAKARSAAADLAVERGAVEMQSLELQILAEVRSAARAVETAAERIESAKVSSHLQQKNVDAERKRYENGLSTSFEVLQIQEDLSEARSAEVSAIIAYRKAETAFFRAIGKLLDHYGVVLSDDVEP